MKKRLILGLIVGVTVFATVFAFAAALTVNGDNLQAGANGASLACDTVGGVDTGWTVAFQNGEYQVTQVQVTGIDAGCDNHDISVTLDDGSSPATVTDTGYTTGGTATIAVPAGVSASGLDTGNVHVAITE